MAGDEADILSLSVLGCFIDCGSDCASMLIRRVCRATVEHTVALLSARLDQITHAGCQKAFSTFGTLYSGLWFRKKSLITLKWTEICHWLLNCEQAILFLINLCCLSNDSTLFCRPYPAEFVLRSKPHSWFGALPCRHKLAYANWRLHTASTVTHWPLSISLNSPGDRVVSLLEWFIRGKGNFSHYPAALHLRINMYI